MTTHDVVTREQWIEARRALLAEEKAWTRERDRLSEKRRALPWVKVDKDYVFEGTEGPVTLADLFDGRGQLVVYHFMFGPEWEEGCLGCSFFSDQVEGPRRHFEHNDVSFVAVSRASIGKLQTYRKRMGWTYRRPVISTSTIMSPFGKAHASKAYSTISSSGPIPKSTSYRASASSTRTTTERFTTRIQAMAVAGKCTCLSTAGLMWCPEAVTKPRKAILPTGCGTMIAIRTTGGLSRPTRR